MQSIIHQEIMSKKDVSLMKLEYMWLINMIWFWSSGTYNKYQSVINTIHIFEQDFYISVSPVSCLSTLPTSLNIHLMWNMEAYNTRLGAKVKYISNSTVNQLRSAAGQFL